MNVAIVDDELEMRQTLVDYIGRFGEESGIELETVTFESGEQFLKNYKMIFDIIIFDIVMPIGVYDVRVVDYGYWRGSPQGSVRAAESRLFRR